MRLDYDLEDVKGRAVFRTERDGIVWTGLNIETLEQIRAPANDCLRVLNNASRMNLAEFYLPGSMLQLFKTHAVLNLSLKYGSRNKNFDLAELNLWGKHRPDRLSLLSIYKSFIEFQKHSMYLTRAYDPRCSLIDVSRADHQCMYLPFHHVATNIISCSMYMPHIRYGGVSYHFPHAW